MVKECKDYIFSSYNEYLHSTGVSRNEALKYVFGNNADYMELIINSFDRKFIDIDGTYRIEDRIENGIKEFFKRTHYDWQQLLTNRNVLKKAVHFMKQECNINYKEIGNFFGISKNIMDKLQKNA